MSKNRNRNRGQQITKQDLGLDKVQESISQAVDDVQSGKITEEEAVQQVEASIEGIAEVAPVVEETPTVVEEEIPASELEASSNNDSTELIIDAASPDSTEIVIDGSEEKTKVDVSNRKGFVIMAMSLVNSEAFGKLYAILQEKFIFISFEELPNGDHKVLYCSALFDEVKEGEEIPQYTITITDEEKVSVERVTGSSPEPKKPKPATYSEMLKARAADKKQKALKLRKNGEAEN